MRKQDQHRWDRERVQPVSSEWSSTMIGEYQSAKPVDALKRTLGREVRFGNVVVSLVIFVVIGGLAVHVLAQLYRG
jgi:hypothetical protein